MIFRTDVILRNNQSPLVHLFSLILFRVDSSWGQLIEPGLVVIELFLSDMTFASTPLGHHPAFLVNWAVPTIFASSAVGLHDIAHVGCVFCWAAVGTRIVLEDCTVTFKQISTLLIANNSTFFGFIMRFSTVSTRIESQDNIWRPVTTAPFILLHVFFSLPLRWWIIFES